MESCSNAWNAESGWEGRRVTGGGRAGWRGLCAGRGGVRCRVTLVGSILLRASVTCNLLGHRNPEITGMSSSGCKLPPEMTCRDGKYRNLTTQTNIRTAYTQAHTRGGAHSAPAWPRPGEQRVAPRHARLAETPRDRETARPGGPAGAKWLRKKLNLWKQQDG